MIVKDLHLSTIGKGPVHAADQRGPVLIFQFISQWDENATQVEFAFNTDL